MKVLTRFGSYTFPTDAQISFSDNFAELVTRTERIPFAHGGFDQLGDERSLSEIGKVNAELWLHYDSFEEATTLLDAYRQIADYGVQRLFMQPTDPTEAARWCWARVNNLNTPQNVRDVPHERMRVGVVFHVPDPFWHGAGNGAVWGGGWKWGDGTKWGGGTPVAASGLLTTSTITPNGNAFTYLNMSIRPDTGESCTDPIIRRVVNGDVIDEVRWYGTLTAGDVLSINSTKREVRLNTVKVYDDRFAARSRDWMLLRPGANTIQIIFTNTTDAADVNLRYLDRWV